MLFTNQKKRGNVAVIAHLSDQWLSFLTEMPSLLLPLVISIVIQSQYMDYVLKKNEVLTFAEWFNFQKIAVLLSNRCKQTLLLLSSALPLVVCQAFHFPPLSHLISLSVYFFKSSIKLFFFPAVPWKSWQSLGYNAYCYVRIKIFHIYISI